MWRWVKTSKKHHVPNEFDDSTSRRCRRCLPLAETAVGRNGRNDSKASHTPCRISGVGCIVPKEVPLWLSLHHPNLGVQVYGPLMPSITDPENRSAVFDHFDLYNFDKLPRGSI